MNIMCMAGPSDYERRGDSPPTVLTVYAEGRNERQWKSGRGGVELGKGDGGNRICRRGLAVRGDKLSKLVEPWRRLNQAADNVI
jgi:hypothetical protein